MGAGGLFPSSDTIFCLNKLVEYWQVRVVLGDIRRDGFKLECSHHHLLFSEYHNNKNNTKAGTVGAPHETKQNPL